MSSEPWLTPYDDAGVELALRTQLLAERFDEVTGGLDDSSRGVAAEVLALIDSGAEAGDEHPLVAAARLVPADLCLLRRAPEGWVLHSAVVCFPSRWRLADKIGRSMPAVHAPVTGYRELLATKVERFFDRLTAAPVWRRNWFIHPNPALYQPIPPPDGDPVIEASHCFSHLWLRSERQTLRAVAPDWALFTIRVQQAGLGEFVATPERRQALARYLAVADPADIAGRGIAAPQRDQLVAALTIS